MTDEEKERLHEEDLQRIRGFRLIDDDFMNACFKDNIPCTELMLRIILDKPDLRVTRVETQELLKNLRGRDVWLDITAKDGADRTYDIEVQRSDKGAGFRRARYHSSMIDSNSLNPGDEFDDLPENYVIFLTENDVIGDNEPIYVIERTIQSSGKVFDDGSHIIYVNGARKDAETELGRLVHDFFCTNPNDMHYEELANVTRYFKETEEGVGRMCKVIEEMRDETARNKAREIALNMIQGGELSLETISKYSGIPLSEVQELANGVVA